MKVFTLHVILLKTALISSAQLMYAEKRHQLVNVIEELNEKLQIQWNLLLTTEFNEEFEEALKEIKIPKFSLLANVEQCRECNLSTQHDNKILTMGYVVGEGMLQRESNRKMVESLAKSLLWQLHHTHILWIYENISSADLLEFAKAHWIAGYMNILYFVDGYLYSYSPVPDIQVKQLHNVRDYWERPMLRDFQRYPLTTTVLQNPPGCYRYINRKGRTITTGIYWRPLELFAKTFNFKLQEYPFKYDSFDYDALVRAIKKQQIDIVPGSFHRWGYSDRSRILRHMNYFLIVPSPELLNKEFYFYLPFKAELWIFNYLLLLATSGLLSYISFRENRLKRMDYIKSLMYSHNCLLYQFQFSVKGKGILTRALIFALFFYGLIAMNFYQAKLSSFLTINICEPKIETLEDLRATNLVFMTDRMNKRYIDNLTYVPEIILERLRLASFHFLYKALRDLNNTFVQGAPDYILQFALFQQKYLSKSLVHKIDTIIYQMPIYFTLRHQLPYKQQFDRFLTLLSSSGLMKKIVDDSLWEGIYSGEIRFFRDHKDAARGWLSFEYFKTPLIIWSLGMFLSFVLFVCEHLHYRYRVFRGK
uniref:Ionotropic glutamate receptor C-terminal domain-containing protein n=1 Tax=Stomoxys calcitrans TaxID=35570 RepID=A0A1I8NPK9_STOCA